MIALDRRDVKNWQRTRHPQDTIAESSAEREIAQDGDRRGTDENRVRNRRTVSFRVLYYNIVRTCDNRDYKYSDSEDC